MGSGFQPGPVTCTPPNRCGTSFTPHSHLMHTSFTPQAALQQTSHRVDYALDTNASLFLNLFGVEKTHLVRRGGRCVYTP